MEFLSRMPRDEAKLIATMGSMCFNRTILFAPEHNSSHLQNTLSFNKLLYLQELGVISGVTALAGQLSSEIPI